MTDTQYNDLHELVFAGAGWEPSNQNAQYLMDQSSPGTIYTFKEVTDRDLAFHRCYFCLLNYIWEYMPDNFKGKVPCSKFYLHLKHLRGQYDIVIEYKDRTRLIEYHSVSFGKMSQMQFESFVREQLPFIYSEVIAKSYTMDKYDAIVSNIELEFERFLQKL